MAGLKPLPKPGGAAFDPASLRGPKAAGTKLVPKRGLVPGKGGHR
jgi:hypothetical protein